MKLSLCILLPSRHKAQQFRIYVPKSTPCTYTDSRILWIASIHVQNCTVPHLRQQQSSCILRQFHYRLVLFWTHHKWGKGHSAGEPYA